MIKTAKWQQVMGVEDGQGMKRNKSESLESQEQEEEAKEQQTTKACLLRQGGRNQARALEIPYTRAKHSKTAASNKSLRQSKNKVVTTDLQRDPL